MKRSKLFCPVFVVAALAADPSPSNAQSNRARQYALPYDGFGPVKVGMTLAQAAKVLGAGVTRDAGHEGDQCYYASPTGGYKDVAFMMSGRRIVRININSKE